MEKLKSSESFENSRRLFPYVLLFFLVYAVKLTVLVIGWAIKDRAPWVGHMMVDIWGWLDFFKRTDQGQIPFVDFSKEYPVGMGYFYLWMGWLIPRAGNFSTSLLGVHALVMSAIDVVNAVLFYHILRLLDVRRPFLFACLFALNFTILVLSPLRHEALVTFTVLLSLWALIRQRPSLSAVSLGVGATLKWYPGVYFAIQFFSGLWQRRWREALWGAVVFTLVFVLLQVPTLIMNLQNHGNVNAWWGTYAFHINRPLYWDTPLGVLTLFFGEIPHERMYSGLSALAMVFFMIFPRRLDWKKKAVLVCLAALVFNRVYSTQFHLWFYPLFLIVIALEGLGSRLAKWWLGFFFALDLLNVLVYPFAFTYALDEIKTFAPYMARASHGPWIWIFAVAIMVRALGLVGLGFSLLWSGRVRELEPRLAE